MPPGTRRIKANASKVPAYSTKRGPDAAKKLAATRERAARLQAAAKLDKAGFHKQAKMARAGASLKDIQSAGGVAERIGRDWTQIAEQTPTGLAQLGTAVVLDTADLVRHPARRQYQRTEHKLGEIGKSYVRNYGHHPLRYIKQHPGNVIVDALGLTSLAGGAVARTSAAGKAASAGAGLRGVARAFKEPVRPGTVELAPGVSKPLSRHPVVRAAQKAANRAAAGRPTSVARGKLGLGSEHAIGRAARAQRRIESDLRQAPAIHVQRLSDKIKGPEHTAVSVVGISGDEALLRPREVIARHVATHEANIPKLEAEIDGLRTEIKSPALSWPERAQISGQIKDLTRAIGRNKQRISDLKKAEPVLENPSPRLQALINASREGIQSSEAEMIRRGHLTTEQAQGRLAAVAQHYGHEGAPAGSFYFPMSQRYTELFGHPRAPRAAQPQAAHLTKPTPGRFVPGLGKQFTGRSVTLGGPGRRVGEQVADVISARGRLASAEDFYNNTLKPLSTEQKMTADQVPLPLSTAARQNLVRAQSAAEDAAVYGDEGGAGLAIKEALSPSRILHKGREVDARDIPIGEKVPGYAWVDRRYVKDMQALGPSGPVERTLNAVNRPIRFGTIYVRPAYMVNKVQNQIMGAMRLGHHWPGAVRASHHLDETVGPENTALIDAGVGTTRSQSYIAGRAKVGRVTRKVETWWQRVTDQNERRAGFIGEARREGFQNPEDWVRLLHDPELQAKKIEIFQRARRDLVDFDSLTPAEQKLAVGIFFYPWLSRGTAWALQTPIENAVKTAALAGIAENAKTRELPWYLAGDVAFKHRGRLYLSNPQSLNTFQTASEVGKDIAGTTKGVLGMGAGTQNLGSVLSPAGQLIGSGAGLGEGYGRRTGLPGLLQSTAPGAALKRAGVYGKPGKVFSKQGALEGILPYVGGGLVPRQADEQAIQKALAKELTTEQKLSLERKTVVPKLAAAGYKPDEIKYVRNAYRIYEGISKVRSDIQQSTEPGEPYYRAVLAAEADYLRKIGFYDAADAKYIKGIAKNGTYHEVRSKRDSLIQRVYEKLYAYPTRTAAKATGYERP